MTKTSAFRNFDLANACRLMLWGDEGRHYVTDQMSSFEIWTAAVMLAGVCARFDKPGKYSHLGKSRGISVVLLVVYFNS